MLLVGDKGFNGAAVVKNFYTDGDMSLKMSNYNDLRCQFCSNSDNCAFQQSTGFSTYDRDHDTWGSHCAGVYQKGAWWYAHCYHHNLYKRGSAHNNDQFSGCGYNHCKHLS